MGISADCKLQMCFIESSTNTEQRVSGFISQMLSNKLIHDNMLSSMSIKSFYRTMTYKGKTLPCYVVETYWVDDRSFFMERWGLIVIMNNITNSNDLNKLEEPSDWKDNYKAFCKKMNCSLEIETYAIPDHKERIIVGVDESILLEEENDCKNCGCGEEEVWDNPDYGKKKFLDIIAEHYAELKIATDLLDVI